MVLDWLILVLFGMGIIEFGFNVSLSFGENWFFNFLNGIFNIFILNIGIEQLLFFNG